MSLAAKSIGICLEVIGYQGRECVTCEERNKGFEESCEAPGPREGLHRLPDGLLPVAGLGIGEGAPHPVEIPPEERRNYLRGWQWHNVCVVSCGNPPVKGVQSIRNSLRPFRGSERSRYQACLRVRRWASPICEGHDADSRTHLVPPLSPSLCPFTCSPTLSGCRAESWGPAVSLLGSLSRRARILGLTIGLGPLATSRGRPLRRVSPRPSTQPPRTASPTRCAVLGESRGHPRTGGGKYLVTRGGYPKRWCAESNYKSLGSSTFRISSSTHPDLIIIIVPVGLAGMACPFTASDFLLGSAGITAAVQGSFFIVAANFQFDKVTDFAGGGNFVLLAVLGLVLQHSYHPRQVCDDPSRPCTIPHLPQDRSSHRQGELVQGREEEAPWAAAAVLQSRSRKPSPHSQFLTSVDNVTIQHFRRGSFLQP